jgi:hypothetical protein
MDARPSEIEQQLHFKGPRRPLTLERPFGLSKFI